jgi:hypothetical protein
LDEADTNYRYIKTQIDRRYEPLSAC